MVQKQRSISHCVHDLLDLQKRTLLFPLLAMKVYANGIYVPEAKKQKKYINFRSIHLIMLSITAVIKHGIDPYVGWEVGLDSDRKRKRGGCLGDGARGASGSKNSTEIIVVGVDDSAKVLSGNSELCRLNDVVQQGASGCNGVGLANAVVAGSQVEVSDILISLVSGTVLAHWVEWRRNPSGSGSGGRGGCGWSWLWSALGTRQRR